MKVKSIKIPCYHYIATCFNCGWEVSASSNSDIPRCRREVIKHVKETGHPVNAERGSATRYELANT